MKRFNIDCIGKQKTLEEIKEEKSILYEKLKKNKNDPEYQKYFFRYKPNNRLDTLSIKYTQRIQPRKSRPKSRKAPRKANFFKWMKY